MNLEVWLLVPSETQSEHRDRVRSGIRKICQEREWAFAQRPTIRLGKLTLLSGEYAHQIYQRMHRARVAVLSLQKPGAGGPLVALRPSANLRSARREDLVSVRHLCRHKAFFLRMRWDRDVAGWASSFLSWTNRVACLGQNDARCLPLHVFSADPTWSKRLVATAGRDAFDNKYGHGGHRIDEQNLSWQVGPDHAQVVLNVAGMELPRGFHWDVNASRHTAVCSPIEEWVIKKYVNIWPDATIRGREPNAKQRDFPNAKNPR